MIHADSHFAAPPFQPGARVLVLVDTLDETVDARFHGMAGRVVGLICDDPQARPLMQVEVDGVGTDVFFANELQLLA